MSSLSCGWWWAIKVVMISLELELDVRWSCHRWILTPTKPCTVWILPMQKISTTVTASILNNESIICDIYALKVERLLLLLSSMPWFGEVDLWVPLALPHFTHLIDHKNIPAAAPKPNERAENKRQSSESSSESFLFLLRLAILLWWGKIWYDFTRRYLICIGGCVWIYPSRVYTAYY